MMNDFRFAARTLAKSPGFALAVVLTLALGIGANAAMFSLVNGLLLRPLPYPQPERLMQVETVLPDPTDSHVPGPRFLDWDEKCQSLEQIAAYGLGNLSLSGDGRPERLNTGSVTAKFFDLLGARPLVGRSFAADDDRPSAERVAIISHALWSRRFDSSPDVIGRFIRLDDQSYKVIGVLQPDFRFRQPVDAWVPMRLDPREERGTTSVHMLSVIARLKPGVTPQTAQAEMQQIAAATGGATAPELRGDARIFPLHEALLGNTRKPVLVLFGAVALVLLIACANITNLSLARAAARQKEYAIRAALGAGRWRLVRQMLAESLLLGIVGGMLGLLAAAWLCQSMLQQVNAGSLGDIWRIASVTPDLRVFGFALVLSVGCGVVVGLAPLLQVVRPRLNDTLKEGDRVGQSRSRSRLRQLLLVSEVSLSIILLTAAGLLVHSFAKLIHVDPGYQPQRLLTMRISLPELRYPERQQQTDFFRRAMERIQSIPGIESVDAINHLPLSSFMFAGTLRIPGRGSAGPRVSAPVGVVTDGYFKTMNIPLLRGRAFSPADNDASPRVVVVSAELARQLFGDQEALGRELLVPLPGRSEKPPTIIGIVGDIKHTGLNQSITPQVYVSYRQGLANSMNLVVRGSVEPTRLAGAIRDAIGAIDGDLPVYELRTMEQRLAESVAPQRFMLTLTGLFAVLATALAAVGVYGVIAYAVTQRRREIGIRVVLGAHRTTVLGMVLKQGMTLAAIGVSIGLVGALMTTRLLRGLLFEVGPFDPLAFVSAAVLVGVMALLACLIPAQRAARMDPMVALRSE